MESDSANSPVPGSSLLKDIRARLNGKRDKIFSDHLSLLSPSSRHAQHQNQEAANAPIFTVADLSLTSKYQLLDRPESLFPQHGLLAGLVDILDSEPLSGSEDLYSFKDPRVFFNTTVPSSTFICGSQGSGKSHTLSCLLENCLIPSIASKLPKALTGLVFHYDTFASDNSSSPCEAAFLASNSSIRVRVLCSPTNFRTIKSTYSRFKNITIEPLHIKGSDLSTKRMLDLMAVSNNDGPIPLYLHTVNRVLREMRMEQQETGGTFDYLQFKAKILDSGLTSQQLGPLGQRLDTLESFMPILQTGILVADNKKKKRNTSQGTDWSSKAGYLTIVDLSCPCVTPEGACSLFNICLSIFIEQFPEIGKVIALDEAHKFMNNSAEAETLTNTLLSAIRLQRHLGARIIISTQEPTISPRLLDLCSVSIVHRFTSPHWLRALRQHLAGAAIINSKADDWGEPNLGSENRAVKDLFDQIVTLKVGQALLFSPNAIVGWKMGPKSRGISAVKRLGGEFLKLQIRSRITEDGGKSVMAN